MSNQFISMNITYVREVCCTCAITFYVTDDFQSKRMSDHKLFCCPNSHSQSYAKPSETQDQKEIKALKASVLQKENLILHMREREKRVQKSKAGYCPDCKRRYKDLEIHFKKKHNLQP